MLELLLLGLLAPIVHATLTPLSGDTTRFFHPSPFDLGGINHFDKNPTWLVGAEQNITWYTWLSSYNITLWQQPLYQEKSYKISKTPVYTKSENDVERGESGIEWRVSFQDLNPSDGSIMILVLGNGTMPRQDALDGTMSHYVNFTMDPSSSALISPSPSPVPLSSGAGSSSDESATHNEVRNVGIGVGLGLGIPFLIVSTVAAIWFMRTKRAAQNKANRGESQSDMISPLSQVNTGPSLGPNMGYGGMGMGANGPPTHWQPPAAAPAPSYSQHAKFQNLDAKELPSTPGRAELGVNSQGYSELDGHKLVTRF